MPNDGGGTSRAPVISVVAFRTAQVLKWACFVALAFSLFMTGHFCITNGRGRGLDYAVYATQVMIAIAIVQLPLAIVLTRVRTKGQLSTSLLTLWIPFVIAIVSAILSTVFWALVVVQGM